MPSYRGVEQAELLSSITDMLDLLQAHSTGPECQKLIDKLRLADAGGMKPLGMIAAATDDKTLADAVGASGASYVFSALRPVLQYHALTDTGGRGFAAVANLHRWDAAGDALFAVYKPLDAEMDSWLAVRYAQRLQLDETKGQQLADLALEICAHDGSDEDTSERCAMAAVILAMAAQDGSKEKDMRDYFLQLDLHERHVVQTALMAMNLPEDGKMPEFEHAFSRYCVEVKPLTDKAVNWTDPSVAAVRDRVEKALSPFYDTDEVRTTGIGGVDRWEKSGLRPLGVIFDLTARAAKAVAATGLRVLDTKGDDIAAPKPKKKPGLDL